MGRPRCEARRSSRRLTRTSPGLSHLVILYLAILYLVILYLVILYLVILYLVILYVILYVNLIDLDLSDYFVGQVTPEAGDLYGYPFGIVVNSYRLK